MANPAAKSPSERKTTPPGSKISVVMSCYNRKNYVEHAVQSILAQTYGDFEFIVIDDASTDGSAEILAGYARRDKRIALIRNPRNMGLIHNLRKGLEIAQGEYIARMDDDDISLPARFEKQVEYMDANPDVAVLGTFIEQFGDREPGESWVTESEPDVLAVILNFTNPVCHPSVMLRKAFLEKHQLNYSPKALCAEDYCLWKDVALHGGKLANLPEVLLRYRVHDKRISQEHKTSRIQERTRIRVQRELLGYFFHGRAADKARKEISHYPFCNNKAKTLYDALEKMKEKIREKSVGWLTEDAVTRTEQKYCGLPAAMHIFFASDDKFARHLCVAMASILVNALPTDAFSFYVLDGGISERNKNKIRELGAIGPFHIEFIRIDDELFKSCPLTASCWYITKQTYYRYMIPKLKPELKKCLYLDCDVVVTDSLSKLWNTNLTDNYCACVEDLWIHAHEYYERNMGLVGFNAGVMLINNALWAKENVTDRLFENTNYLADNGMLKWQDQDVLNYTFGGKVIFVNDYTINS